MAYLYMFNTGHVTIPCLICPCTFVYYNQDISNGNGNEMYFVFTVLPFGLATTCYAHLQKLIRPLMRYWQGRGLKAIVYLDDGIISVEGRENALRESVQVRQDLVSAGFIVNHDK